MEVLLAPPCLIVRFEAMRRVASWAIVGGGLGEADTVTWLEVKNADLGVDVDPATLLSVRLRELGLPGAVGLLTSRALAAYEDVTERAPSVAARSVVTVGLGNALRAGDRADGRPVAGTINLLCAVDAYLSDEALLEAMALASEAKALAIREASVLSTVSRAPASGTGTDCIVIASAIEGRAVHYAGKHTQVGQVIGESVRRAVALGAERWKVEQARGA